MTRGYLLDTQVLYWMSEGSKHLGPKTKQILRIRPLYYSTISIAELGLKARFKGLKVNFEIANIWQEEGIEELTFDFSAARDFSRFSSEWVPDPFDRQLMAVASANNLDFLTSDRMILATHLDWVVDATT